MKLRPISRVLGLMLFADGCAAFASPGKYLRQLQTGTPLIDDIFDYFAENPDLTRKLSAAEIALGVWLLIRP